MPDYIINDVVYGNLHNRLRSELYDHIRNTTYNQLDHMLFHEIRIYASEQLEEPLCWQLSHLIYKGLYDD
jgi:hypothetical protein